MAESSDHPEPEDRAQALHESQERFRVIVESVKDFANFTTDLERRFLTWNEGAGRLTGYSEAGIAGRSSDIIFVEEDRERGIPAAEAAQALAEGRAGDDRWHLRHDGRRFSGSGLIMPLRDEAGQVRGFAKILRDTTDRRVAETRLATAVRELEESEQRHRLLVSEIRDYGIFMLDPRVA